MTMDINIDRQTDRETYSRPAPLALLQSAGPLLTNNETGKKKCPTCLRSSLGSVTGYVLWPRKFLSIRPDLFSSNLLN